MRLWGEGNGCSGRFPATRRSGQRSAGVLQLGPTRPNSARLGGGGGGGGGDLTDPTGCVISPINGR